MTTSHRFSTNTFVIKLEESQTDGLKNYEGTIFPLGFCPKPINHPPWTDPKGKLNFTQLGLDHLGDWITKFNVFLLITY